MLGAALLNGGVASFGCGAGGELLYFAKYALRAATEDCERVCSAAEESCEGGRASATEEGCLPGRGIWDFIIYSAQDSRVLRLKSADRRLKTLRLSLMLHCVHIYIYVCGVHIILYYYICVVCGECVGLQTYIRECHLTTSRSLHDDGGSLAGLNSLPSKEFNPIWYPLLLKKQV